MNLGTRLAGCNRTVSVPAATQTIMNSSTEIIEGSDLWILSQK